ncbi:MAG: cytochrome c oxidase accessory protein CcoG [Pseudomonadota bacterium]
MVRDTTVETFDAEAVNAKDKRQLYAARQKIHPKRASGSFRSLKWIIMAITLGIYYITPWIRWDRGPYAPDQAVLVDMANRRFYFFFIEIWPHEFFFVAGMLVMAGIGLFLVTSTVGRAWCGYTCPQTVWVDLFLVVERFFEGERNARIRLDKAPISGSKALKRTGKHVTWLVIAVATGGAWIFYFADAPTLAYQFVTFQAPFVAYATVAILTATTYVFGGLMREQVCTYMCPWPRVQAAMLDEHSLTVTYNDWRGEPRTRHAKKAAAAGEAVGDCVDCNACVAVCPMGIDIRDGQQLECITCALCIDACDGVMEKIGREKGLISYATLNTYAGNMALATGGVDGGAIDPTRVREPDGKLSVHAEPFKWSDVIRPRTMIYTFIYAAIGIGLVTALLFRDRLDLHVLHDRNPVFTRLSDGSIRNGYEVKILNMELQPRDFTVTVEGLDGAHLRLAGIEPAQDGTHRFEVGANQLRILRAFVTVPADAITPGGADFAFSVNAVDDDDSAEKSTKFEAPKR